MPKVFGVLASALSQVEATIAVYTCPEGHFTTATVAIVNTGEAQATIALAITTGNDMPLPAEWIEYELPLDQGEGLERSGIIIGEGNTIWLQADVATVACNVFGIEQPVE